MERNKIIWTDKNKTTWTADNMTTDKALKIIFWANKLVSGDINNTKENLSAVFDILTEKTIQKLISNGALQEDGDRRSTLIEDAQSIPLEDVAGADKEVLEKIPQKVKQYNSKTGKYVEVDLYPADNVIWTCGDGTAKTKENIDTEHLIRLAYWLQGKDNKGARGIGINTKNNVKAVLEELKNRTIKKLEKQNGFKHSETIIVK